MVALVGALLVFGAVAAEGPPAPAGMEIVATGVPRPLQLAIDGATLIVLSPGAGGDVAGELYRVDVGGELPVDLSRQPRVRIPYRDERLAALGSLALHPITRELFLGEENGHRVYRLGDDGRLTTYAVGLQRLSGGGTLVFDADARLIVVDYVDPRLSPGEERTPPGLEQFREEDYRGPLVFRLTIDSAIPLPRRLGALAPLFPRAWGGRQGGALLPRLISAAPQPSGQLTFLSSNGSVYRLGPENTFGPFTRLPAGQYNRTTMLGAPDGSVFVSGGFHASAIFRIGPDGAVTTVATNLSDPEGIALDARGDLYVAESSYHRIVRLRGATPLPPSRR